MTSIDKLDIEYINAKFKRLASQGKVVVINKDTGKLSIIFRKNKTGLDIILEENETLKYTPLIMSLFLGQII